MSETSSAFGALLPSLQTEIPGPKSIELVSDLAQSECPAITARRARRERETGVPQDPIVWERSLGANIEDVDGNVYVDLTAAFAVCGLGHNPPQVVEAAREQVGRLTHAMGDVYPSRVKVELGNLLAEIAPGDLRQSIFGLSGADAVQAALKTAVMHTGKPGVIAFWGGYHGLSYGALSATAYRKEFREPFLDQLSPHVQHVPFPDPYRPPFGLDPETPAEEVSSAVLTHLRQILAHPASGGEGIGAIIVEPLQGRGGEVVPPPGFLAGLRELCDEFGLVLIFDEIYTGLGRTGDLFACEHVDVIPDIMCIGKAMGGGFPISAAIGRPEVMGSWGLSSGEAIHTSTFLGNPLGCAMAKAAIATIVEEEWPRKVRERGEALLDRLNGLARRFPTVIGDVRGRGLMLGIDLVEDAATREPNGALALALTDYCRKHGYLVLPSGVYGNVLALSPPFVISDAQLDGFFEVFEQGLSTLAQ
ncbi:aspartate aminotransferase family protein [Persicimonas caeni]|uniref:Aspartate aminotransferase family protein n=1 Tax=Persicimonas caeni TaxID=2292766 RepID=A0A4Y6PWC5_PERCE|nr:aspartate aminotransferase family protein [Persicimonas caeni]QDG52618.1 aspartate aminotransferase family protein [Persicimonas caeni]QED33840.1 aspartate aminotransferase family protein [Persicimonas caeni]